MAAAAAPEPETACEWLLQHHAQLFKVEQRILTKVSDEHNLSGCILSLYAPRSATTPYRVVKVNGKVVYAHMALVLAGRVRAGNLTMWDTNTHHVSHECHNPACVNPDHLALIPKEENLAKNIHCIGIAECALCHVSIRVCVHPTPCLTHVMRLCSACE